MGGFGRRRGGRWRDHAGLDDGCELQVEEQLVIVPYRVCRRCLFVLISENLPSQRYFNGSDSEFGMPGVHEPADTVLKKLYLSFSSYRTPVSGLYYCRQFIVAIKLKAGPARQVGTLTLRTCTYWLALILHTYMSHVPLHSTTYIKTTKT